MQVSPCKSIRVRALHGAASGTLPRPARDPPWIRSGSTRGPPGVHPGSSEIRPGSALGPPGQPWIRLGSTRDPSGVHPAHPRSVWGPPGSTPDPSDTASGSDRRKALLNPTRIRTSGPAGSSRCNQPPVPTADSHDDPAHQIDGKRNRGHVGTDRNTPAKSEQNAAHSRDQGKDDTQTHNQTR